MRRRDGLAGVVTAAGLLAAPAWPQQPAPRGRIGYLHPRTIAPDHSTLMALREVWTGLGYVEGRSVLLRSANDDLGRVPALVGDLQAQGIGVLIVVGAAALRAVVQARPNVPIVAIDLETDPVRAGYAASLARPGGAITGVFMDQPALAGKWIDLLREAVPDLQRIALLWDAGTGQDQLEVARSVVRARGVEALTVELGAITDFDAALRPLAGRPRTGIVQLTTPGFAVRAPAFAAAARRNRIPAISFLKTYARMGVMMTYGPVQDAYFGRAAIMADRILRGTRAGDVPIEGPDRFELVIHRGTAAAIGVTIPNSLLLRADEVIA